MVLHQSSTPAFSSETSHSLSSASTGALQLHHVPCHATLIFLRNSGIHLCPGLRRLRLSLVPEFHLNLSTTWLLAPSAPPWTFALSAPPGSLVPPALPWSVITLPSPWTFRIAAVLYPCAPMALSDSSLHHSPHLLRCHSSSSAPWLLFGHLSAVLHLGLLALRYHQVSWSIGYLPGLVIAHCHFSQLSSIFHLGSSLHRFRQESPPSWSSPGWQALGSCWPSIPP